jgi:hypothetical protein
MASFIFIFPRPCLMRSVLESTLEGKASDRLTHRPPVEARWTVSLRGISLDCRRPGPLRRHVVTDGSFQLARKTWRPPPGSLNKQSSDPSWQRERRRAGFSATASIRAGKMNRPADEKVDASFVSSAPRADGSPARSILSSSIQPARRFPNPDAAGSPGPGSLCSLRHRSRIGRTTCRPGIGISQEALARIFDRF